MRCVTKRQGEKIMREVHGGDCGEDQSQGRRKGKKINVHQQRSKSVVVGASFS